MKPENVIDQIHSIIKECIGFDVKDAYVKDGIIYAIINCPLQYITLTFTLSEDQ